MPKKQIKVTSDEPAAEWIPIEHPKNKLFVDMTGLRFGMVSVQFYVGDLRWLIKCDCGRYVARLGAELRRGNTKHCGCLAGTNISHGHGGHHMYNSPEYRVWDGMIQRCENENHSDFSDYGGRGIVICKRWRESFQAFYDDIGPRPSPRHSIDRIDVNGNYESSNCRWATSKEQQNNRRNTPMLTAFGKTMSLADWARYTGIKRDTLYARVMTWKWSHEAAVSTVVKSA